MMLTQEQLQSELHYNPETGIFTRKTERGGHKIGSVAGSLGKNGYIEMGVLGGRIFAHRAAWLYVYGYLPKEVDHIDRVRDHNWISNLRAVSHAVNMLNTPIRKHNTSGHTGVYWSKAHKLWTARIFRDGRVHSLGYYRDKQSAVQARQSHG